MEKERDGLHLCRPPAQPLFGTGNSTFCPPDGSLSLRSSRRVAVKGLCPLSGYFYPFLPPQGWV
uniref:Uncharacterized protein n=1 Tax=Anguilla anguilla TaxID=7936 RepID=A0A0E9WM06_ANGAN